MLAFEHRYDLKYCSDILEHKSITKSAHAGGGVGVGGLGGGGEKVLKKNVQMVRNMDSFYVLLKNTEEWMERREFLHAYFTHCFVSLTSSTSTFSSFPRASC